MEALLQNLTLPDLWQQQCVHALRAGKDVVVHAPTGAGKTFVFELFHPELRAQAVFTVPTRALANDKLAEWRNRGWDVGISTGDLAIATNAKIVVATLETQKDRFLRRAGPRLLVIDEYQMIGDPVRGVNYELAIALAPPNTQLLLLSGSVANPDSVVQWLRRIGRDAVLVSQHQRPVPLEEFDIGGLPQRDFLRSRDPWTGAMAGALQAGLGPVLMFAPRRNAAEDIARSLAAALPPADPLALTPEQQAVAGPKLTRLLQARVAYHHSGLSYAQRAGLIEPLAKNGQLRVVVATMGLAAGINFSMRSVIVTGTSYKAGNFERQVQPDELLQMFGRAGRRGLDKIGYALVGHSTPRLADARPRQLRRAQPVDWPTSIALMRRAAEAGSDPFAAALDLQRRLFTPVDIPLGVERSRLTGPMPCALRIDADRARFHRRGTTLLLNSQDQWEPHPGVSENGSLSELWIREDERWIPALASSRFMRPLGHGALCRLNAPRGRRYGRELPIGTRRDGALQLAPWLRTLLGKTRVTLDELQELVIAPLPDLYLRAWRALPSSSHPPQPPYPLPTSLLPIPKEAPLVEEVRPFDDHLRARFSFDHLPTRGLRDSQGRILLEPPTRNETPAACASCTEAPWCADTHTLSSPAHDWRRLGLIDADGIPTKRGILFSFFHHGEGLAIAAALEDQAYPIEELLFDLANLRAGERFAGDDQSPMGGRLGILCQRIYDRADIPGYLEMGVPLGYGSGASETIREIVQHQTPRRALLTDALRQGDIERALIEWRSLLRHITWAADYPCERWRALRSAAAAHMDSAPSPSLAHLPPLTSSQRRRA